VIILDTNQLHRNRTLDTPTLSILAAVARVTDNVLALPAIVIEEFVARYEHDVSEAVDAIGKSFRDYRGLNRTWSPQDPALPPAKSVAMEHGTRLRQMFEILVVTGDIARMALSREILRQRPASIVWKNQGSGARDAAIWLTVLEQLRQGDVYFVSDDKVAFGDGQLHAELEAEASQYGGEGQLVFCPNLDVLLQLLAQQETLSDEETQLIANDPKVHAVVQESLTDPRSFGELITYLHHLPNISSFSAPNPPVLSLEDISRTTAYRVEGQLWISSRIKWTCQKEIVVNRPHPEDNEEWIARFRVSTTLLVSLGQDKEVLDAQTTAVSPLDVFQVSPALRWLGSVGATAYDATVETT
jgi:hypothetical protein